MSEKVAVIGMGQMGSGMAGRLREFGLDVVGYDINADSAPAAPRTAFRWPSTIARSPRRAGRWC